MKKLTGQLLSFKLKSKQDLPLVIVREVKNIMTKRAIPLLLFILSSKKSVTN